MVLAGVLDLLLVIISTDKFSEHTFLNIKNLYHLVNLYIVYMVQMFPFWDNIIFAAIKKRHGK